MRGESKYHYVDLALIDEQPETNTGGQIEDGDVGTTGVSVAGG